MHHEILGDIQRENDDGNAVARIRYGDLVVEIQIMPDDTSFEEALQLAAAVAKGLGELDSAAKAIAASELLDAYNNGWNEYDEVQADGSIIGVSNPQLSEVEFTRKLTLEGVNVYGSGMIN